MADQKKWFKVWTSILSDPDMAIMSLEDMGRWVKLGAMIALHGNKGKISIVQKVVSNLLKCEKKDLKSVINSLPNVHFNEGKNDNTKIIVSFKYWNKYQKDSTGYSRLKKFRAKQTETVHETPLREDKKRGEKKRKEESKKMPLSESQFNDLILNVSFLSDQSKKLDKPMILIKLKIEAIRDWSLGNNKKVYSVPATLRNWFAKDDEQKQLEETKKDERIRYY